MADVTISGLTNRQPNSSAVFPYSEGGTTYNASVAQLLSLASGVPTGVIVMWSGSIASIPSGWVLCNGSNGTPDLRSRFIVGAGTTYNPGNIGGLSAVQLTINEIPAHNHAVVANGASGWGSNHNWIGGNNGWPYNPGWNTSSAGGGGSHENRPPYYALAYIMKL